MTDKDRYSQILKEIYTTRQCNQLLDGLKHAVDATFDNSVTVTDVLRKYLPFDQTDTLVEIAKENQVDLSNKSQSQPFITQLIHRLKELPTVDLTLAYSPPYHQLHVFSKWWRSHTDPYILLNITIQKDLIAGAMIGYNGVIQDYSLQNVLGTYIDEKTTKQ